MAIDYNLFSRADWTGMKAANITKTLADGKTNRLDTKAIADRIAQYLVDKAKVNSGEDFNTLGVSLTAFTHKVCGLPETASEEAKEMLGGVIKARLAGTSVGDVQSRLDGLVNQWLVKGDFLRTTTDDTDGTSETVKKVLWACTTNVDIMNRYAAVPAHKRVLSAEYGNLRDTMEQIKRVPEFASHVVAIQRQRLELVSKAQDQVYARVTAKMSPAEIAAFDAEVNSVSSTLELETADLRKSIESA